VGIPSFTDTQEHIWEHKEKKNPNCRNQKWTTKRDSVNAFDLDPCHTFPYLKDGVIALLCKHITGFNGCVKPHRVAIIFPTSRRRKEETLCIDLLHDNYSRYHIQALF